MLRLDELTVVWAFKLLSITLMDALLLNVIFFLIITQNVTSTNSALGSRMEYVYCKCTLDAKL